MLYLRNFVLCSCEIHALTELVKIYPSRYEHLSITTTQLLLKYNIYCLKKKEFTAVPYILNIYPDVGHGLAWSLSPATKDTKQRYTLDIFATHYPWPWDRLTSTPMMHNMSHLGQGLGQFPQLSPRDSRHLYVHDGDKCNFHGLNRSDNSDDGGCPGVRGQRIYYICRYSSFSLRTRPCE